MFDNESYFNKCKKGKKSELLGWLKVLKLLVCTKGTGKPIVKLFIFSIQCNLVCTYYIKQIYTKNSKVNNSSIVNEE